jgi:hypothetical protein
MPPIVAFEMLAIATSTPSSCGQANDNPTTTLGLTAAYGETQVGTPLQPSTAVCSASRRQRDAPAGLARETLPAKYMLDGSACDERPQQTARCFFDQVRQLTVSVRCQVLKAFKNDCGAHYDAKRHPNSLREGQAPNKTPRIA